MTVTVDSTTSEQRCENCAPGYDCERGIYTPTKPSSLLADPTTVALLRDLYAHAHHVHAEHATYEPWQPKGPLEHTWTAGELRVSYRDGELRYLSHGVPLLKVHVVSVRQAAQVLAAIGVLPPRFAVPPALVAAMAPDICWTATTGGAK